MTKTYQSKDFYLASFLVASGFPLLASSKVAGLTIFEFEETTKLNSLIEKYYGFTASVNPITYANSMRTLKTIIHANINPNDNERFHTPTRKVS
jgi:hypothetical protein